MHRAQVLAVLVPLVGLLSSAAQKAPDISQIPPQVMKTLKAKFPKAEIHKWTRETEAGATIYDIEFLQEGRKFEADIKLDGSIHNWERQVEAADLPAAVRKTLDARFPKAVITEALAITAVTAGKEALEGYEILLKPAGGKEVEVTIAPGGKLVEGPK